MDNIINERIASSISVKKAVADDGVLLENIRKAADVIVSSLKNGGRVMFCGNGGSAADAQHLAAELSGRYLYDRPPLNADALHCNTSYITAVANDYGYDKVYARILEAEAHAGDVMVGISTSGNSENIYKAFIAAKDKGVNTVALTGATGGRLKDLADILINVPSTDTPRIQESHIMIGHIICEIVEKEMFPQK